jgi:hypothetical protein
LPDFSFVETKKGLVLDKKSIWVYTTAEYVLGLAVDKPQRQFHQMEEKQ